MGCGKVYTEVKLKKILAQNDERDNVIKELQEKLKTTKEDFERKGAILQAEVESHSSQLKNMNEDIEDIKANLHFDFEVNVKLDTIIEPNVNRKLYFSEKLKKSLIILVLNLKRSGNCLLQLLRI